MPRINVSDSLVLVDMNELMKKIDETLDRKLEVLAESIAENLTKNEEERNDFLTSEAFCERNKISRGTLWRYAKDGKIEVMELSPRTKRFRWKE